MKGLKGIAGLLGILGALALSANLALAANSHKGFTFVYNFKMETPKGAPKATVSENTPLAIHAELGLVAISREAVEKGTEFLLSASMIPQHGSPTSHGNISRIVTFVRRGQDILMMASTQGQVVTNDLPSRHILAKFHGAAEAEHEGRYYLNWDFGMRSMLFSSDWHASDIDGKSFDISTQTLSVGAQETMIDEMKYHVGKDGASDVVEIRQILQLHWVTGVHLPNYEARYYLQEYKPNPDFKPKETTNFKRVGYFEANPQLELGTGRSSVKISKWSIAKPITYYVSANTPKEYVDAVREGILYWNKAFGYEVLRAELAPEGVTAPDPNYNIVQWVPWDLAGSAYADGQMDPRTGEILHAQVYMTSAFAASSKLRLQQILQNMQESRKHKSQALPLPAGFEKGRLCNYQMNGRILKSLEDVANDPKSTDADVLRVTQHYIREVVAHEIGHTLGLRHNFVGTMAANVTLDERDAIFRRILKNDKKVDLSNVLVTSSVMAYAPFRDAVIEGQSLLENKEALPYDKMAIQFAYLEDKAEHEIDRKAAPIFCTDSHVGTYSDCRVFTSGPSPLANAMWEQNQVLRDLPNSIVAKYKNAKGPQDARDRMALDEISFSPKSVAKALAAQFRDQLQWLNADARSAYVERPEAKVDGLNSEELQLKKYAWVKKQIEDLGGVERVYFNFLPISANWANLPAPKGISALPHPLGPYLESAFEQYLNREDTKNFVGADGQKHSFSEAEMALIRQTGHDYISKIGDEVLSEMLSALLEAKINIESELHLAHQPGALQPQIERRLQEVAEAILLSTDDKKTIQGEVELAPGVKPMMVVRADLFPHELRAKAAQILSSKLSTLPGWSMNGRRSVVEKLTSRLKSALGEDPRNVPESRVGQPLREWVMHQKEVLRLLSLEPGCSDLLQPPAPKPTQR